MNRQDAKDAKKSKARTRIRPDYMRPFFVALLGVLGVLAVRIAHAGSLPAVTALAYSPDGTRLAVGTYGQVVLYDTSTWQPAATFLQIDDAARSLAFSPDAKTLAIGSGQPGTSGRLTLWDSTNTRPPQVLAYQKDTIETVAFRKDGSGLLVGANDNKGRYYNALPAVSGPVLDEHNGRVQAVAFSPRDNFIFATGGMDRIVKVWDEKTGKVVLNFDQSEGGITGLAFLPSGTELLGCSLDGRLYVWRVSHDPQRGYAGNRARTVDAHPGGVTSMALSADGKRVVTGGMDSKVIVWDPGNGRQIRKFEDSTLPLYAVALSPDGKLAAAAGREGVVRVWSVEGNSLVTTLTPPALPAPPAPTPKATTPKPAKKQR
jgi:WD40 repeat protein